MKNIRSIAGTVLTIFVAVQVTGAGGQTGGAGAGRQAPTPVAVKGYTLTTTVTRKGNYGDAVLVVRVVLKNVSSHDTSFHTESISPTELFSFKVVDRKGKLAPLTACGKNYYVPQQIVVPPPPNAPPATQRWW